MAAARDSSSASMLSCGHTATPMLAVVATTRSSITTDQRLIEQQPRGGPGSAAQPHLCDARNSGRRRKRAGCSRSDAFEKSRCSRPGRHPGPHLGRPWPCSSNRPCPYRPANRAVIARPANAALRASFSQRCCSPRSLWRRDTRRGSGRRSTGCGVQHPCSRKNCMPVRTASRPSAKQGRCSHETSPARGSAVRRCPDAMQSDQRPI